MKLVKAIQPVALLLILLVGCGINQKREMEIYRSVLDEGQVAPADVFNPTDPLTLKEALGIANTHSEALALSGEDYLQALINKDRAFARFLPTIAFAPSFMRQEKTSLAAENPLIEKFVRDQAVDMPVEGGVRTAPLSDIPAVSQAAYSAEMKRALLLDGRAVLMLDVAQTYYQVLRAENEIDVLSHSVEVQTRRVSDISARNKAGVARSLDVSQAKARLSETRTAVIRAENDAKNGRAMLAMLLGVPDVKGKLIDGFEVPTGDWPVASLIDQAMTHREDLQASHARVSAAAKQLQAAWGEYFPSVSLNLTRYLSRESFPEDVDWTGLLAVRIPIFSAGLVHADVRTAYSRLRQANFSDSLLRRRIVKELRSAREDLIDTDRRIKEINIQISAAKDAARQVDAAYRSGTAINLEAITARDDQLKAELAGTSARFERTVNYLRLLRAVGCLDTTLSQSPIPVREVSSTRKDAVSSP